MLLSAELTMYPLQDDYLPVIKTFIDKLHSYKEIAVDTRSTATVIQGDYEQVMDCIRDALRWSHEQQGKAVFLVKYLPEYEAIRS